MYKQASNLKIKIGEEPAHSERQYIDVLFTQEYRFWQPEEGWMFLTSSEKGENKAKNTKISLTLTSVENINPCIMTGSV